MEVICPNCGNQKIRMTRDTQIVERKCPICGRIRELGKEFTRVS